MMDCLPLIENSKEGRERKKKKKGEPVNSIFCPKIKPKFTKSLE